MTIVGQFTVQSPWDPARTFTYVSDLARFDEWDPGIRQAEQVAGDGPAVGARYRLVVGRLTLHYEVEQYASPQRVRARAVHPLVMSIDRVEVRAHDAGSEITYRAELTPRGIGRLAGPLLSRTFEQMTDDAAEGMARAVEGRRVA